MKTFLVVNPSSANASTGKQWLDIESHVRSRLGDFAFAFTREPLDAEHLTRQALQQGYDCIVAVGGDGTISEVVNGFFQDGRPVSPSATFAVVPRGTGGDFRRTFGWDIGIDAALDRIGSDKTQALDVGRLEFTTPKGQRAVRHFINVCSFGVSGLVDQEVNRGSKLLGGKLTFMVGSVRALLKYSDQTVRVSFDGGPPETLQITTLAIGNGRYFGGGMQVAPQADPADGWFDVTVWRGYRLWDFMTRSRALYDGTHVGLPGTSTKRCKVLEALSDQEVLLDVDGEQPGRLPCKVTLLPNALRVKV
jgi:YegS/Rv2252/BmrU family lipid kinase